MSTTVPDTEAKIIFSAEDRTESGVASAKDRIEGVAQAGNRASKAIGEAGSSGGQAGGVISAAFSEASRRIDKASATTRAWADSAKQLAGSIKSAFVPVTVALAALVAAIKFGEKMATEASVAQSAAARLQIDITAARSAFGGYVKDVEIARLANKAFSQSVVTNGEDFARLARGVVSISKDIGAASSTELLEETVNRISKKNGVIIEGTHLTLDQARAEEIYADWLGKSVQELSRYEKAQSFTKAAILEIEAATRKSTKANDSYADSWKKSKVSMQNFIDAGWGFDVQGGKIRETLRDLDADVLELFGSRKLEDIDRINRALGDSGLSYEQIRDYLIEINNIETLRGGQMSREQRLQLEKALNETAAEALGYQERAIKNQERIDREAAAEARAEAEADAVAEMQQEVEMLRILGAKQEEILQAERDVVALKLDQAEAAEKVDDALVKQLNRELEIADTKIIAEGMRKKGGGGGPTLAEREQAAGERGLQILDEQIRRRTILAEISGKADETAARLAEEARNLRLAELDLEQHVLEVTRARNSVERTQNANRLEAIRAERELLDLDARVEAEREVTRLVGEATALSAERAQSEANSQARRRQIELRGMDDERAALEHRKAVEKDRAKTVLERLDVERERERDLTRLALARLERERDATLEAIKAKEDALRSQPGGDPLQAERRQDEFRQLAHEREIARLDYEAKVRRTLEAEKIAQDQAERDRSDAKQQQLEDGLGQFEHYRTQVSDLASFFQERRQAADDAEVAHAVAALEARGRAQHDAFEREIEAAKGNVGLQQKLRQDQARTDAALQKQIELTQARHQDKVTRANMRTEGIGLAVTATVEGIKAIAAAADLNIPQALAHGAVATAAGIKAAMLMSGKIPGGGAVESISVGGGGTGGGMAAGAGQDFSDPSNVPGSRGAAEHREPGVPRRPGQAAEASPTVIVQGDIVAYGAIDDGFTENLARKLKEHSYRRED
jgi:hypothetical protein